MNPISASDIRNRKTPIPTPMVVRALGSLSVAGSVAVMASQAPLGTKALVALLCTAIAVGLTLAHPYRKAMRAFAEAENVSRVPSISMLLPLMLWWLALMLAPLAQWPVWGAVLTAVVLFGLAWVLYPHVDGTRRLAYA